MCDLTGVLVVITFSFMVALLDSLVLCVSRWLCLAALPFSLLLVDLCNFTVMLLIFTFSSSVVDFSLLVVLFSLFVVVLCCW